MDITSFAQREIEKLLYGASKDIYLRFVAEKCKCGAIINSVFFDNKVSADYQVILDRFVVKIDEESRNNIHQESILDFRYSPGEVGFYFYNPKNVYRCLCVNNLEESLRKLTGEKKNIQVSYV